ncbi:hypothetical protein MPDQ_004698 [Monascus purpureus]|uniref:tripeptidyl-peptidase II n=1 Tax=Monascus purpureus TaxID=5098 RepID=A0A507QL29_MONPU|nr:hypothetical protein MPDQ_004698 [Monascus purpureus]BDD60315.1 hypothetical protein MAP00_005453 [Monascus purpureus]
MRALLPLSVLASGLAALCRATPISARDSYVVHEKRDLSSTAAKWTNLGRLAADSDLTVRIGLKQSNLDNAHVYMRDIAHPDSPNYGKHWTSEQVLNAFAPSEETVANVKNWLVRSGIDVSRIAQSDNKVWLGFSAPVSQVESLLQTRYYRYQDNSSGSKVIACEQYRVPSSVQGDIDYVVPGIIMKSPLVTGNRRPAATKKRSAVPASKARSAVPKSRQEGKRSQSIDPSCGSLITPDCISNLYQIPEAKTAQPGNELGIFEQSDSYSQEDLDLFFTKYSPWIPNGTHPILNSIDGGKAPVPTYYAGAESELDFELAFPIVYPQSITLYQTQVGNLNGSWEMPEGIFNPFLDAIDGSYCKYCAYGECGDNPDIDPSYPDPNPENGYNSTLMCGVYKPTNVVSISYGRAESDLPASYQQRQCNEFMKLGLQGISIVVASGDSGVASRFGCIGPQERIFNPDYPGTCPWLTMVGSTGIYNDTIGKSQPEIATVSFPSGGGFSNIYPIPDYQSDAVAKFFKDYPPPYPYYDSTNNNSFGANGGLYNRNGRGFPDVSALGDNIATFTYGESMPNAGTSASAPIFASILNRINEERLAAGKGTVGFVNHALYANPSMLNDVTGGSNPGCNTKGFSASPGWDPVTGLGTPNYPKMLEYFLSLP